MPRIDTPEIASVDASLEVFEAVAAEPLRVAEPEAVGTAGREPDAAAPEDAADADDAADEAPVGAGNAAYRAELCCGTQLEEAGIRAV